MIRILIYFKKGLRLISPGASDLLETKAFNYHFNDIHIYSNSWGPLDNGYTVEGPREFAARAIEIGALKASIIIIIVVVVKIIIIIMVII